MGKFLGYNSVAKCIGSVYGNEIRKFTALLSGVWAIGVIAVQFKVFGQILQYIQTYGHMQIPEHVEIFGYSTNINDWIILISGIIVTLYSMSGGIRSVMYTDVLQFLCFSCAVPIIGFFIFRDWYYC